MDANIAIAKQKFLVKQRNILLLLSVVLLITILCLSIYLLSVKPIVILTPATLSQTVNVQDSKDLSRFSEKYLGEQTVFFTPLFLDLTPENIAYKTNIILEYADPQHRNEIKQYFDDQKQEYAKYNLSTYFQIDTINIDSKTNKALVTGILHSKFGLEGQKSQKLTYELTFAHTHYRLFIKSFIKIESTQNAETN